MTQFSIYAASVQSTAAPLRPVIVSWWAGAGYKPHADRLAVSIPTDDEDYMILHSQYDPQGWEANCAKKPSAILAAMNLFPGRDVLWVDADATIEGRIDWAEVFPIGCDIACLQPCGQWPLVNSELLSGTLGFRSHFQAKQLLREWEAACKANPKALDQDVLNRLVTSKTQDVLRVGALGPRYVCIADLMPNVKDPIILHHQASRSTECRFTV